MADVLQFPPSVLSSLRRIDASLLRVHRSDPLNPPTPPPGAHAVEVRDRSGRVVSYGWVDPAIDRNAFVDRAYGWTDQLYVLLNQSPATRRVSAQRRKTGDA